MRQGFPASAKNSKVKFAAQSCKAVSDQRSAQESRAQEYGHGRIFLLKADR